MSCIADVFNNNMEIILWHIKVANCGIYHAMNGTGQGEQSTTSFSAFPPVMEASPFTCELHNSGIEKPRDVKQLIVHNKVFIFVFFALGPLLSLSVCPFVKSVFFGHLPRLSFIFHLVAYFQRKPDEMRKLNGRERKKTHRTVKWRSNVSYAKTLTKTFIKVFVITVFFSSCNLLVIPMNVYFFLFTPNNKWCNWNWSRIMQYASRQVHWCVLGELVAQNSENS